MSIICIAKGTATIGLTTRGADGQIISQTPARWEHDPDGGCVALWTMNPETEEQEAPARIYGDWQASEYLGDVLAELKPRRKVNLPDFPAIVRAAMADGMDICVYVAVKLSDGEVTAQDARQTVNVVMVICVCDPDPNRQGYRDALHIVNEIVRHYERDGIVANRYEAQHPIRWATQEEDTHPYYFAAVGLPFYAPAIFKEVPET